ncbi:MAG TPA: AAA family ATPase [Kofleriaceae bacterium]|nr:AAA family ATPase [Kofleriaceae bacterium]
MPIPALEQLTRKTREEVIKEVSKGAPRWFPWRDIHIDPDKTTVSFAIPEVERTSGGEISYVRDLRIHGMRGIEALEVTLPSPGHKEGQWMILLGENGAGKTTILRAIALALASEKLAVALHARSSEDAPFIRRGNKSSSIEIGLSKGRATATINTSKKTETLQKSFAGMQAGLPIFGYGSQRGSATGGPDRAVSMDRLGGLATLFDSSASLIHAETWLVQLAGVAAEGRKADKDLFEAVKATLAKLLPRGDEIITVERGRAVVRIGKEDVPFAGLSDGYLTTLGWTIDLIARWSHQRRRTAQVNPESFASDMRCIVLVDELDLHLHPRWQCDIVDKLRQAFPSTTFIATTHNPLTLHGTRPGEVYVVRRTDDGALDVLQRDLPAGIRADQILTGDWFGLTTTVDADTQRLLEQHRQLLLAGRDEHDAERRQLEAELRSRLGRFAETSVERLAQGVAAEILDETTPITAKERARVKAVVRERLRTSALRVAKRRSSS